MPDPTHPLNTIAASSSKRQFDLIGCSKAPPCVKRTELNIKIIDHGLSVGHHGFWGHGEDTWPSNMHRPTNNIPLIISYPEFSKPGLDVENLVGTTDIYTTILELAACEQKSSDSVSGKSLLPLLKGETTEFRDEVFMEQEETRAIRTSKWLFMKSF
jgi:arylsulfatase A-like enzyme